MMNGEAYKAVELEYAKLQESIEDLAETINDNIAHQKEEIERSHKSQMRKLGREIEELKLEKSKLQESIANNERANLLENERDWYKKEAIHLDKVLEQTKAQNKELKEKLDESEADRKWMKEELEKVSSIVRASEILPLA
jgi:chromosome segregation ATPase